MVSTREVEMLPGTEVMREAGNGHHFVHAEGLRGHHELDLILVPQPSGSLHDPLNWSRFWKVAVILNQTLFVITSILTPLAIAPLTPIFMAEWGKSASSIAILTGAAVLSLGYANFIIIPFTNIFGRRSASLICCLLCVAANIWQAVAKSYGCFLGARILSGSGAAANESIMTVVVADVMFLHERGTWMGLYFWAYFLGLFIGPIMSGNIAARLSWRWFFWICTILQVVNFLTMLLTMPETKFSRHPSSSNIEPSRELPTDTKVYLQEVEEKASSNVPAPNLLHNGRPNRHQFALITSPDTHALKNILYDVITPVRILFIPIILWASLSMGFAANLLLDTNLTQSQVFAAPPYNFSPGSVGLCNLAFVGGGILGLLTAGPLSDFVSAWATRRNGGIREAEMRLPVVLIYAVACLVGSLVIAYGYQNKWSWEVIIIIGYGLVGLQVVSIPTIAISYAVDSYKSVTGEIMVIATVCKNSFGFGMTYYINDWAVRDGFIGPVMLVGGLTFGVSTIGALIFYFFGKTFRRWSSGSRIHKLNV